MRGCSAFHVKMYKRAIDGRQTLGTSTVQNQVKVIPRIFLSISVATLSA